MTKLLYIPTGEYISFVKTVKTNGIVFSSYSYSFTPIWEESQWHEVWKETIEDVIDQFCNMDCEHTTKLRHNIPIDKPLTKSEFEILTD